MTAKYSLTFATIFVHLFLSSCEPTLWSSIISDHGSKPYFDPLSSKMINYVNNVANTTWKAAPTNRFKNVLEIKNVLGVLEDSAPNQLPQLQSNLNVEVPDSFDARIRWPRCKTIRDIRDQSTCGSCWAFGAVESMSDRICIASNGTQQVYISAQDLLSCCGLRCGFGCNGGLPPLAWRYWVTDGIVTGGSYHANQGCQDYSFPPRKSNYDVTPECKRTCQPGYPKTYCEDKHFGEKSYCIILNVNLMQSEIMTHGPVEAAFIVFSDFFNYKTGVYQHVAGSFIGLHAVKILGWGVENGTPYWLGANSWNTTWGDNGFFKIKRGNNECGIETLISAGIPKL